MPSTYLEEDFVINTIEIHNEEVITINRNNELPKENLNNDDKLYQILEYYRTLDPLFNHINITDLFKKNPKKTSRKSRPLIESFITEILSISKSNYNTIFSNICNRLDVCFIDYILT